MINIEKISRITFAFFLLVFTACQTESVKEVHSTKETITKTTPLASYVERIVMQKTSQDNLIDHSSCFAIKFPYAVTVNNVQITINSVADYQLVQHNMDANSSDNDVVSIHFPISVIRVDYSEISIANQLDFNNLIATCQTEASDFGKINCLTIKFPITINSYDSNNEIVKTITITNNESLFHFLDDLEDNKFIAFNYPISVMNSSGQNVIVSSNSQLENLIKNAVDSCPENTNSALDFSQTIISGSWKISYFFDENEKTSLFDGFSFVFYSNFKVVATKSGIVYNGTWSTKVDNGIREFEIKFESDLLNKIDENWKTFEFNETQLRFRDEEDNLETDYLYFTKN